MSLHVPIEILVVEDDPQILTMMMGILTLRSILPTPARNDGEAVARLAARDFDGLLVDVKLTGRRGFDTLQFVRSRLPHMLHRTVAVTADVSADVVTALTAIDVCDVVPRPVDMDAVVEAVERCCADLNVEVERRYWRRVHHLRPYGDGQPFESFEDAYRLGWEAAADPSLDGRSFADIEADLARQWEPTSRSWSEVRQAVADAFDRVRERKRFARGSAKSIDRILGSFD